MPRNLKEIGAVGILERSALPKLNAAVQRVYDLMSDLEPHTSAEIDMAAGTNGKPARRGLARLHDLRQAGYDIVPCAEKRAGQFQFKMLSRTPKKQPANQLELLPTPTRRFA